MKQNIYNLTLAELQEEIVKLGDKKYRAQQIFDAIYPTKINYASDISNIPKSLQKKLDKIFDFTPAKIVKTLLSETDGSIKFALKLNDGYIIECVILKARDRRTLCLSSQVGCGLGCVFCETSKIGFKRNLSAGEMIYQLVIADTYLKNYDEQITNIVFMGMGEALSNFDNFVHTFNKMHDQKIFDISTRKITVSTAGVIPSIKKLMESKIPIDLAISLNASTDEERSKIMPINKTYDIKSLLEISKEYAKISGREVMFEYVMVSDVNDSADDAKRLTKMLKNIPCKLNLIPLNDCTAGELSCSAEERIGPFTEIIHKAGIRVMVRRSGGKDIGGACGQLAGSI